MHASPCRRAAGPWHVEFAIEAALLGAFMVSALAFTVLVEHPASPLRAAIDTAPIRRLLVGIGMGATAVVLIYSRWGQRSGAHMNPAVTVAFARLGLICPRTALGYVAAQFVGAIGGVALGRALFGLTVTHPSVNYAVTTPSWGAGAAFGAELLMTMALMTVVLAASSQPAWRSRAGLLAAGAVATFITIEAPVSGMSLNPARTLGSAVWAGEFAGLWIYFAAPVLGMLLAAEGVRQRRPDSKDLT